MNFNKFDFYKLIKILDQIHYRIYEATHNANYNSGNCKDAFVTSVSVRVSTQYTVPNINVIIFESMEELINEI
jgi:hypothetical protein